MAIPLHNGLGDLAADYDALILDLWGVIYDGVAPYAGVLDCLAELRRLDKRVILLSNAPRLAPAAAGRIRKVGIGEDLYERVVTSGDATRQALERRDQPFYEALGRAYYFLGKGPDADLLQGLDYRPVEALEDADFLLVTGPTLESLDLADYEPLLGRAAELGLAMVCANPDLAVIRGGVHEPCAGAFAARYAELGGAVGLQGKPYPAVYDMCLGILEGVVGDRILCVGDSLATDIRGAVDAGLPNLLVTGGLLAHGWGVASSTPPDPGRLAAACADAGVTPMAAIPLFVW
jgi:HAD superfamily hydrolase (TIGR01459 family)